MSSACRLSAGAVGARVFEVLAQEGEDGGTVEFVFADLPVHIRSGQ
jgi:hypothetical protein